MVDALKYWVWLSSIPGVGSATCKKLLDAFGTPMEVWGASEEVLKKSGILTDGMVKKLSDKKLKDIVKRHLENILENGIGIITFDEDIYPQYLKKIYDPPAVLYVKGNIVKEEKVIAVVGSRKASSYGLMAAETIARELSRFGITVISGMARGIDSRAHYGALKANGRTIAVLGCGLDIVYPPENDKLMEKIIHTGAAISEYLPGFPPKPQNFPARNRIISGISLGVVVIEAGENSGSLITADFALEQGREVFAVPGNIDSFNSQGTNKLIRDGAKIVTGIDDILEEIMVVYHNSNRKPFLNIEENKKIILDGLDNNDKRIAECLWDEPLHIDLLAQKSGLSMQQVNSVLVMMELRGIIEQEPGKIFKLKK